MPLTLWFNHAFSSIRNIASLVRRGFEDHGPPGRGSAGRSRAGSGRSEGGPAGGVPADGGQALKLLLSHSNPQFVARPLADEFLGDVRLPDDEYAEWCLDVCLSRGVDVFWPFRGARAVSARRADFEAAGTIVVVCATAENLDVLNDKALFYRRLEEARLEDDARASAFPAAPRYRLVSTYPEFLAAVDELTAPGVRICLKPCKSTFGLGFKIIQDKADPLAAFLAGDPVKVSLDEAKSRLDVPDERFPRLLVMELLPGPEYSVDCLARGGRLVRASIRKKPLQAGRPEELVENPEVEAISARLCAIFGLEAIANVQLIESPEGPRLLEINPRMAGGLYFSCLGGVNYPYWALALALGADESLIPGQRSGLLVNQYCQPFVYAPGA